MNPKQYQLINDITEVIISEEFSALTEEASSQNAWFTPENIHAAALAIKEQMLDPKKIAEWLKDYDLSVSASLNIGIVMAGNIPMVGFFDLYCTLLTGNLPVVKLSSKDSVLMGFIIRKLNERGYIIETVTQSAFTERKLDKIITMGGDEAARFYSGKFAGIPQLIRKNRHSIAILSGSESSFELEKLLEDMFQYWGMGCRNVSTLYLPRGYDTSVLPSFKTDFKPFIDNYKYNKAVFSMNKVDFVDKSSYLLVENMQNPPTAVIGYSFYDNVNDITIEMNDIQCIVTNRPVGVGMQTIKFGESQNPKLSDYPDQENVLKFLLNS